MAFLTVCAFCKTQMKKVIDSEYDAVSHGICDDCLKKHYPTIAQEIIEDMKKEKP